MKLAWGLMALAWINSMFLIGEDLKSNHFLQCCTMSVLCAIVSTLIFIKENSL